MTEAPERIWKADNTHPDGTREYIRADLTPSPEVVKELVEALRWYGEQARLAGLIHSEGNAGRYAISNDGGKRANAIIAKLEGGE